VLEKQYALFPQQTGRLGIAPVMAEVRLPSGSSFDPFRTGGEIRRLRSQQAFIDVEAIPTEYKAPYWLPANKIELREDWQGDLSGLIAGEPITRSLTLVAEGLTAAQLPELVLLQIDGIKQYPDQPGLQDKRSSRGVNGTRVQKVALIPGAAGSYMLPEISLPWWNLQTGKPETATIPARELIVNAALNAIEARSATPSEHIPATARPAVETQRFWLWLSLLLACGWALSALYWWRRSRQAGAHGAPPPEHSSLRQARKKLQQACIQGDAAGARQTLLTWGQVLLEPRQIENLHQLVNYFDAELALEIQRLNQSLYAQVHSPWQGEDLWRLCQQLEKNLSPNPDATGLQPLNPAA